MKILKNIPSSTLPIATFVAGGRAFVGGGSFLKMETFKDIVKLEGKYQVSNLGRIKNVVKDSIKNVLTADDVSNCYGYIRVAYTDNSEYEKFWVHEAVINSFHPETVGKKLKITHIDGNKSNNILTNLKWEIEENIDVASFVAVKDYEGLYSVSKEGIVISHFKNGKVEYRKGAVNENGYCYVQLWKDNKGRQVKTHRMVAIAFIPNIEDKPHVNHIDGNKLNNAVENLEWVTRSENMIHAYEIGLIKMSDKTKGKLSELFGTKIINTETGEVFSSIAKAEIGNELRRGALQEDLKKANRKYLKFIIKNG